MTTGKSLRQIERQAYRSTFEDGIYDLFFAAVFLVLAIIPALESLGISRQFGFASLLVAAALLWSAKRWITVPRLGAVEFGVKRQTRRKLFLFVTIAFLFLIAPLLAMPAITGFGADLAESVGLPLVVILVVAPLIVAAGYFLDCPRMYIYAAVLSLGIPQAGLLFEFIGKPYNALVGYGMPGVIILGYGLTLLFTFVNKYPKSIPEAPNVSG